MKKFNPAESYIRVATATPIVALGNIQKNVQQIKLLFDQALLTKVSLVVFPELCITGYSIGDMLHSNFIIEQCEQALSDLANYTESKNCAIIVGVPVRRGNALYNCAAFIAGGKLLGIVPKTNLPTYKEFYEKRWFQSWDGQITSITIDKNEIPFGPLTFMIDGVKIGIEICEDVWVAHQPSESLVAKGAIIICNPSASPEMVTKADYRKSLISNTSARLVCGYIYAGADYSESTMDTVMGGHALIYQMGRLLNERKPFSMDESRLTIADIDTQAIMNDRIHDNNFIDEADSPILSGVVRKQNDLLTPIDPSPFIPKGSEEDIYSRLEEIITIQAFGLKKRLENAKISKIVLGLSGGLDSTLSLLVALRTAELLDKKPKELILTLTMPGLASSNRTQSNAQKLAKVLGAENRLVPISELAKKQLLAIDHSGSQDITYENTQARLRTALLFNTANSEKGLVLGTGDLSEIALGWCTFNGDHMSAYNVNASIPKTLVKYLVRHEAYRLKENARKILLDILDTPISPELVSESKSGITQKTEDLVGPYELHDFFLFHFIRWMETPDKILYLANLAFKETYESDEIERWLRVFINRFLANQWKRSVMPDGPKVGSVSLSPRGDWRMPSDIDISMFNL